MRKTLDTALDVMNKIYLTLAVLFLLTVICACVTQVFTRYILNNALMGTEEVTTYSFMWMTMLGIARCTARDTHSTIGILNDLLKGKAKDAHKLLIYLAMAVGMAVMFTQGVNMMKVAMRQRSSVLRIPMYWVYLSIPVGCFGVLANLVPHVLDRIQALRGGRKEAA